MIKAYVGSGGKTTSIFEEKNRLLLLNRKVLICTSTHMKLEEDTIVSNGKEEMIQFLNTHGYVFVGTKVEDGKIGPIDYDLYLSLCELVDDVLIEADGSKRLPLKVCNEKEPVIYDNVDEIVLIAGCRALNRPLKDVCHRYDLLNIDENTLVTPNLFQSIYKRYLFTLKRRYPNVKISSKVCQVSSLYEQAFASCIERDEDVDCMDPSWFDANKHIFIFGAGYVGYALSKLASFLDFHVHIMDERKEYCDLSRFDHVDEVICDSYSNLEKYIIPNSYFCIMTPQHENDYQVLKTLIHVPYTYLGMIGSKKKVAYEFSRLIEEGVSLEKLNTVHAPIGLKIGSQSPNEIAVSIMAEIIQIKNSMSQSSISYHLYESNEEGVLCILVKKEGSSPRNVGSMMLVTEDKVIDTIGGGLAEYKAIRDAKGINSICTKAYNLENTPLGVCGGTQTILFIPIHKQNAQ